MRSTLKHGKSSRKSRASKKSARSTNGTISYKTAQPRQEPPEAAPQTRPAGPFQSSAEQRKNFWDTFVRAVESEPVQLESLKGASGLAHPIVAMGIDRVRKRLVLISGDPDGRSAVLAQADIQAAYQDHKIILARPIAVNLARAAEALVGFFGKTEIGRRDLSKFSAGGERTKHKLERRMKLLFEAGVIPAIQALGYAALNAPAAWQDAIIQLSHIQLVTQNPDAPEEIEADTPIIKFGSLVALDPAEMDRRMGVCSVPLYELSADEVEVFHSGTNIGAAREVLKSHHVFQYFFPAPDHLALGLIEKNQISSPTLVDWVGRSPEIGHPFGPSELIASTAKLGELVDMLKERGLSTEGEFGLELTESGRASRATVKFKPREGFLSKLSNLISVKLDLSLKDLKDLFKP